MGTGVDAVDELDQTGDKQREVKEPVQQDGGKQHLDRAGWGAFGVYHIV